MLERADLECLSHANDHTMRFKAKLIKINKQIGKRGKQIEKRELDFMEVASEVQ